NEPHLLFRTVPCPFRGRTGAVCRAQGHRAAGPRGRCSGQPDRARPNLVRPRPWNLGAGCSWWRVSISSPEGARCVIPLYGFLEGDSLGLLVLADEDETVGALREKLLRSAALRAEVERGQVVWDGRTLDPGLTVRAAGMRPLTRFDVRR